jgi:hypothetical protein
VLDVGRDIERIRDYLSGRLSDEESEAFGERLVRDPQLVRELERTVRLSEGLRLVGKQIRPLAVSQQRRAWLWQGALAAAAAVGVLAVGLWAHSAGERAPLLSASLSAAMTREVASPFTFVAVRGNAAPTLRLPSTGILEFRVAPPPGTPGGGYRVTLLGTAPGEAPQPLGSTPVAASPIDGYLHVYADAARLTPGHYLLKVLAGSGGTALEVYPFSFSAGGATPP